MNRRKFIIKSCIGCMSTGLVFSLLESCGTSKVLEASISGSDIIVPLKNFVDKNGDQPTFKNYLIIHNDILQYPVCVYRFDENTYQALLMKCTHQGTELQVFGDRLQCPAHGSAFNSQGKVENGPASNPLRAFPVTISNNQLKISLK
ncbi:MAG: Rieske (2Fe-2S) protein [Ferruginibacter sp.]|nr:Rieske (2Fe-2S) protein [Ferruginibacter sp.]